MVGELEKEEAEAVSFTVTVGGGRIESWRCRLVVLLLLYVLGYSSREAKSSLRVSIESRMKSCSRDATEVDTSAAYCREEGRP